MQPPFIQSSGIIDLSPFLPLHLSGTAVTDAGLAALKDCKDLTTLNLPNTKVSDAVMVHLKGLTNLKALDLRQTQVTAQGHADLKRALPECKNEWEP